MRESPIAVQELDDSPLVDCSIIGEDKTLSVKFGAEAGDASTEDIIVIRGIRADVDRAVKEIKKIVEDAQNDEIVSSYVGIFPLLFLDGFLKTSPTTLVGRIRDRTGIRRPYCRFSGLRRQQASRLPWSQD